MPLYRTLTAILWALFTLSASARPLINNDIGLLTDSMGGDFTLTDPQGQPVSLHTFRGRVVLLYFGYTTCPDVCPMSLALLKQALQPLDTTEIEQVQGLFVTLDPERDSAVQLQHYTAFFHRNLLGLRGDEATTRAVAKQWQVGYQKQPSTSATGYLLAHTDFIYLLDRHGELAGLYRSTSAPTPITAAIRQLLAEPPLNRWQRLWSHLF